MFDPCTAGKATRKGYQDAQRMSLKLLFVFNDDSSHSPWNTVTTTKML